MRKGPIPHGTSNGRKHYGCTCDPCVDAERARDRERYAKTNTRPPPHVAKFPGYRGRPWERTRQEIRALGLPCHICGEPIDYEARGATSRGFSVDHIVAVTAGGHPTARENLAPAHFGCNSRKGGVRRPVVNWRAAFMDLAEAIASGDRRLALEAIRERLVIELSRAQPREVAALSKLIVDIVRELDSMPSKEASAVDDLATARAARRAKSAVTVGTGGGVVGGS